MNLFLDIFTYAFRGSGKYMFATCALLWLLSYVVRVALLVGMLASVILFGYLCAVYFQLIQSTAAGRDEAPPFIDTSNFMEDIIWPLLQIFVVAVASFLPSIWYSLATDEGARNSVVGHTLLGFGVVYFPMAMLAVVVLGRTAAVSPHIVIPAIVRSGWLYWLAVLLLGLLYFTSGVIEEMLGDRFFILLLLAPILSAYTLMTNARILGIIYRDRQHKLGWL